MADKWTAINSFWNSFNMLAYDENTVPDGAKTPYITYEASMSDFDDRTLLTASIWYTSNSWAEISQKATEISNYIGGGAGVDYDGGRLWITKAAPFAQRMVEAEDSLIRRIVLQVYAEFH